MAKELIINITLNKQREPVFTLQNDDGSSLLDNSDAYNVHLATTATLVRVQNKTWNQGKIKPENLKVYEYTKVAGKNQLVAVKRTKLGKFFYVKTEEIQSPTGNPAKIDFMIADHEQINCSMTFSYYENAEMLIASTIKSDSAVSTAADTVLLQVANADTMSTVHDTVAVVDMPDERGSAQSGMGSFGLGVVTLLAIVLLLMVVRYLLRTKVKVGGLNLLTKKTDGNVGNADESPIEVQEAPKPAAIVVLEEPAANTRPVVAPRPVMASRPAPAVNHAPVVNPTPRAVTADNNVTTIRSRVPLSQCQAFIDIADMLDKLLYATSYTSGNAYSDLLTHINMRYLNFRHQVEDLGTAEESQNAILDQFGSPYNWICEVVRLSAYLKVDQSMRDMCACVKLDYRMIDAVYRNTVTMCEDYGVRLVEPVLFKDMYIRSRYIALETPLITKFIPEGFDVYAGHPKDTIYDVLQPGCIVSTGEVKLPVVCYIHDNNDK